MKRLAPAALLITAVLSSPSHAEPGSYGFVRELDGASWRLLPDGERSPLRLNEPLLTGDYLTSGPGSRLDARLADGTAVQLASNTEVVLAALAMSGDSDSDQTTLHLLDGELTLQMPEWATDGEPPRIDLPNATLYLRSGRYRLRATSGWSEVVVREGYAEVLTERGSSIVRHGERLVVEGDRWVRVQLSRAPESSPLEQWMDERLERSRSPGVSPLDEAAPELRYASASLDRAGAWMQLDGSWAWRPRVDDGWQPYWDGQWVSTASGYTWLSYEPWGWVPYHYGSWSFVGSWGWVWFPGHTYAPAHVYWYFGPDYVGWCPIGTYYRAYGVSGGVGHGVHGWAHGRPDGFPHWSFVSYDRLHEPRVGRYGRSARQLRGSASLEELPAGILASDTRPLAGRPLSGGREAMSILEEEGRRARSGSERLRDVSDFVAQRPNLPAAVREAGLRPPALEPRPRPVARDLRPRAEDLSSRDRRSSPRSTDAHFSDPSPATRGEPTLYRRPLAVESSPIHRAPRPSTGSFAEPWRSGGSGSAKAPVTRDRSVVRRIIDGFRSTDQEGRAAAERRESPASTPQPSAPPKEPPSGVQNSPRGRTETTRERPGERQRPADNEAAPSSRSAAAERRSSADRRESSRSAPPEKRDRRSASSAPKRRARPRDQGGN